MKSVRILKGLCRSFGMALFLSGVFHSSAVQANMGETYGFGSRSAALAGATAAWGFEGFAAYNNPAGLTVLKQGRFTLSLGLTYHQPVFDPIDHVVTDNSFVSDAPGPITGNVSVDDYRPTFGTVLGASLRLAPHLWNLSAGLTVFMPLKQLAYLDTGQAYVPEYVLYRARTQRPQVYVGAAVEPLEGFSAGVGVAVLFNMTSNADVFVQTDSAKPTTMKFAASLTPELVPYFGLLYVSDRNGRGGPAGDEGRSGAYSVGVTVRLAGSADSEMSLKTNARVLNPLPALPINFQTVSAMYYDPLSVELGSSVLYHPRGRLYVQLDYQAWSQFQSTVPTITPGSGVSMSAGGAPAMNCRDIFVPRVGHEWRVGIATWRLGYSYRPSIFTGPPTGAGNALDPDRDIFTAGVGLRFQKFLDMILPWTLDVHGTYQSLRGEHIDKTPGDELGHGAGARKIGAPGYDAAGYVWGLGLSASVAI